MSRGCRRQDFIYADDLVAQRFQTGKSVAYVVAISERLSFYGAAAERLKNFADHSSADVGQAVIAALVAEG